MLCANPEAGFLHRRLGSESQRAKTGLASFEPTRKSALCHLIVVGGHTRSIGKTQLVCDLIATFPDERWLAGKITQYGHGVCAQNGKDCDCAPTEHVVALDWELPGRPLTKENSDTARFLEAGAARAFWLRTKQGYLAEGMPLLRDALGAPRHKPNQGCAGLNVIIESNSLLQFVKPSLYLVVFDASREDFKDSARLMLDRADVFVHRPGADESDAAGSRRLQLPSKLLREKPSLRQRLGEPLPESLRQLVKRVLESPPTVTI